MRKKYDKLTNRKTMIITFGADQISKPMRARLRNKTKSVNDVVFRDIKSIYKLLYEPKIELGYSIVFEYRGVSKILIYN